MSILVVCDMLQLRSLDIGEPSVHNVVGEVPFQDVAETETGTRSLSVTYNITSASRDKNYPSYNVTGT